jgi:hypothetical protein
MVDKLYDGFGLVRAAGNESSDTVDDVVAVMSDETKTAPSTGDLLRNSLLYRQFQAEREEILKHKWYESEKAGRDIGFDKALTDWALKHRSGWLKRWKKEALGQRCNPDVNHSPHPRAGL